MPLQTSPKEIKRTIDFAEQSFSRMIHRLKSQYELRERRVVFNERWVAYEAAKHHHCSPHLLGILKARFDEAEKELATMSDGDGT